MSDLKHPAWCAVTPDCTADEPDQHVSRWLEVPAVDPGDPSFRARLFMTVYAPLDEYRPMVELECTPPCGDSDEPDGGFYVLDAPQVAALLAMFTALSVVTSADTPNLVELPAVAS